MNKLSKIKLTTTMLNSVNAECIGWFSKNCNQVDMNKASRDGYYFLTDIKVTDSTESDVLARYFAGRQRSNQGFGRTLYRIQSEASTIGSTLVGLNVPLYVYYISPRNIKHIFSLIEKNWLKRNFPKTHDTIYQNLNEVNRMLNDKFIFRLQKY